MSYFYYENWVTLIEPGGAGLNVHVPLKDLNCVLAGGNTMPVSRDGGNTLTHRIAAVGDLLPTDYILVTDNKTHETFRLEGTKVIAMLDIILEEKKYTMAPRIYINAEDGNCENLWLENGMLYTGNKGALGTIAEVDFTHNYASLTVGYTPTYRLVVGSEYFMYCVDNDNLDGDERAIVGRAPVGTAPGSNAWTWTRTNVEAEFFKVLYYPDANSEYKFVAQLYSVNGYFIREVLQSKDGITWEESAEEGFVGIDSNNDYVYGTSREIMYDGEEKLVCPIYLFDDDSYLGIEVTEIKGDDIEVVLKKYAYMVSTDGTAEQYYHIYERMNCQAGYEPEDFLAILQPLPPYGDDVYYSGIGAYADNDVFGGRSSGIVEIDRVNKDIRWYPLQWNDTGSASKAYFVSPLVTTPSNRMFLRHKGSSTSPAGLQEFNSP